MSEEPRALIIDLARKFGGASARALALLSGFPRDRGALVCLKGTPVHRQAVSRGLAVHPVATHKIDPRIVGRLALLARQGRFDVLDAQNPQSKLWASLAARRAGVALVSTLNSWYEAEHRRGIRGLLYQTIERRTTEATDLFIAVSRDIRDRLIAEHTPEAAIALIPNAVFVDLQTIPGGDGWLASTLAVPRDAPVLCAVGRLVTAKSHWVLVDAMALLPDPKPYCVVVGEGRLRPQLESRIARLGLAARVLLLGHREPSEVLGIVRGADVFVMPSSSEGTPIALLEAAALGRPIVATRVGGIPEMISDGDHARLVPPDDPAALAGAIREVLVDPLRSALMGRRAQRHVAREFGLPAQVQATLRAYETALSRARQRLSMGDSERRSLVTAR